MTSNKGQLLSELDEVMIEALPLVHVNMPWKYLPDYLDRILDLRINIEIGLEADQLDGIPRSRFRSAAEKLHERG